MEWIIALVAGFIGFFIGVMATYAAHVEKYTDWKHISLMVTVASTGENLHADRFRFSVQDDMPYLRIYEDRKFQWRPIWYFKNPYIIMLSIDPKYAKGHLQDLFSVNANNLKNQETKWFTK